MIKADIHDSSRSLEDAFHVFNEMSLALESSYRDLEQKVERLSGELSAARSERLRQLKEKERLANRLEKLLDALPGGVLVLDGDGIIRQCNPVAIDLLGEPLEGRTWREVTARAFDPEGADGREITLNDGRRVSVSVRPLGSEPGQIVLLKDVSETFALQEMVSRQQRLTEMGEMAASLAHQIRTPLASALLYISNLARPNLQEEGRQRFVERIRSRLRHMERMVNDMLVYARGGSAGEEEIEVAALFTDFAHTVEPHLKAVRGTLKVDNRVHSSCLRGNREALLGALVNLADNAIQVVGEGLHLSLAAEVDGSGGVVIRVRDNGEGVPADIRDEIFTPFYTTRPDGTGLGLAVVRAVVEAHHGSIRLGEEEGGAEFILRLPNRIEGGALLSGADDETLEHIDAGIPALEGGMS